MNEKLRKRIDRLNANVASLRKSSVFLIICFWSAYPIVSCLAYYCVQESKKLVEHPEVRDAKAALQGMGKDELAAISTEKTDQGRVAQLLVSASQCKRGFYLSLIISIPILAGWVIVLSDSLRPKR